MTTDDWDLIRIDGPEEGKQPLGRNVRVYRNGVLVPGLVSIKLETGMHDTINVTMTQHVRLEGPATLEEATQALEEREAAWQISGVTVEGEGRHWIAEHRPGEPESLIPNALRPKLEEAFADIYKLCDACHHPLAHHLGDFGCYCACGRK